MASADSWDRLVGALDDWASVVAAEAGAIDVLMPGGRRVTIVMTADEWDDMVDVLWGSFDDAVEDVKRTLLGLRAHERFAVYSQYRLEPSADASLPQIPDRPGSGEWVVTDGDGEVVGRLGEWEPDD